MLSDLLLQLGIALLFVFLGSSMVKGNIKLLHSYHRKRIQEKDYAIVGKLCGIGLYVIALGIGLGSVLMYMGFDSLYVFCVTISLIIGIVMNLYAIIKYNKGLF